MSKEQHYKSKRRELVLTFPETLVEVAGKHVPKMRNPIKFIPAGSGTFGYYATSDAEEIKLIESSPQFKTGGIARFHPEKEEAMVKAQTELSALMERMNPAEALAKLKGLVASSNNNPK